MTDIVTDTELLTEARFPEFVCAGEALTDLLRIPLNQSNPSNATNNAQQWQSLNGGSTWNVARSLAKLGLPCAFAGAISQDVFGDALYAASAQANLDLRFIQRVDKSPLLAIVAETSPPKYFFIGDDSADLYFAPEQLPDGWISQLKWAHFGGISLAREPLASTLIALAKRLKSAGVRISYDPNYRNLMDAAYTHTLSRMAQLADVIKVSDEDLSGLFPTLENPEALKILRAYNPSAVILYTRGAQGASVHCGTEECHAQAATVTVCDTVGAGDASIAGFLYSLSRAPERNWQQHLNFSIASGAAACMSSGAQAPDLAQIDQIFTQIN